MHTTECAYVAHCHLNGHTQIALKKLTEVSIQGEGRELETKDDHFEIIEVGSSSPKQAMKHDSGSS